jgi:uncharacterized membrane protein YfcA
MWEQIVVISIAGFLAATVDAIAGGGGLISLPALLLAGIPPHLALGTNKFASTTASFTSTLAFARSGKVNFSVVKWQVGFTFIGATLGVLTVLQINPDALNKIVPALILCVGLYTALKKNVGRENHFQSTTTSSLAVGCFFALGLGFYDGFFGPGTGSFLIFAFIATFGFDFLMASASAKALNFTSNLASLLMFALNGKIALIYGLPMAVFMILGARVGTRLAITNGARLIKPVFVTMSLLVAIKIIYQAY